MSPSTSVSRISSNSPPDSVEPPAPVVVEPLAPDPAVASDLADRSFHAWLAKFTGGLSPAAVALAFADWQLHLLASPGKRAALAGEALQHAIAFAEASEPKHPVFQPWSLIKPPASDRRFSDPDWELPNFNLLAQAFLLTEQWWHSTTSDVRGLAHSNAGIADFALRQCLDMVAPTNFAWSNPEVLRKIMETGGGNFVSGLHNWIEDWQTVLSGGKPGKEQQFVVGKDVAVTPGKVVYRNELIELIQYAPRDSHRAAGARFDRAGVDHEILHPRPFAAQLAGALPGRERLHRVHDLMEESDIGRQKSQPGRLSRARGRRRDRRHQRDHAGTGDPCGGLLPWRYAAVDRRRAARPRSSGLPAFGDACSPPKPISPRRASSRLFINESQVAFLEDMMWRRGVLDPMQMAGAFQMLRSNDLIWSRVVRDYLIGERAPPSDLMSWNADATRMPYRDALGLSAPAVPRQRSRRRPLSGRWQAHRAVRSAQADVRRRYLARPRCAVEVDAQDPLPRQRGRDLCPDQRRT